MPRFLAACLALMLPLICLAADDARPQDPPPACGSHNQGQVWPEAANHDSKLLAHLVRCGELLICVRGTWHYHWESPSIRLDQLGHASKLKASKPSVCEVDTAVNAPPPESAVENGSR